MEIDIFAVQKAYKRWAKFYNFYFGWIFHPGRQTAVELVESKADQHVLEVGVGTGLSLPLYPRQVSVTGIDISPHMLEKAKELVAEDKLENVKELLVMNAEEMTFADNSFDCVVAMYVATVVPSPKKFVNEMKRVCKPGGKIIILNHFNDQKRVFGKMALLLTPISRQIGFRPNLSLADFLRQTGIKINNKISVNLFDIWTVLVVVNEK
ncbi:MAG: class I SAM-dependent methyltransferase [Pseudomonadota bacterium]|nr:class I SAM-dependent methyltransferase [Pseudomonadota bacterium]